MSPATASGATGDRERSRVVESLHIDTSLLTSSHQSQSPKTPPVGRPASSNFNSPSEHYIPIPKTGNALSIISEASQDNGDAMAATNAETVPMDEDIVKVEEGVEDSPPTKTRICPAFNDTSANVVLQSSDGVIFYLEDYYLKANR